MNPVNYFIEHFIAGLLSSVWIIMGAVLISSVDCSFEDFFSSNSRDLLIVTFLIPFIYFTGILIDRLSDIVIPSKYTSNIRAEYFNSPEEYWIARSNIYINSENLSNIIEYNRMRIRICRVWMLSGTLIIIFTILGEILEGWINSMPMLFYIIFLLFSSLYIAFFSWKKMYEKECRFIQIQSKLLNERRS